MAWEPQSYLDPRPRERIASGFDTTDEDAKAVVTPDSAAGGTVPERIFADARKANEAELLLPDVSNWQAGDVILFCDAAPNKFTLPVILAQQVLGRYDLVDARWHHAAVYLGDYIQVEAALAGVMVEAIYKTYVGNHLIRVRRPRANGKTFTKELGMQVALQAALTMRTRYDERALGRMEQATRDKLRADFDQKVKELAATYAQVSGIRRPREPNRKSAVATLPISVMCASLYAFALEHGTNGAWKIHAKKNIEEFPMMPAALSNSEDLEDVEVKWVKARAEPQPAA